MATFDKVGLACVRDGKVLLCRPKVFDWLLVPGGLREAGETDRECLAREIKEELGSVAVLDISSLHLVGEFEDVAAGRAGDRVHITLYGGEVRGPLRASSEIAELVWFDPEKDPLEGLSSIVRFKILPVLLPSVMEARESALRSGNLS